MEKLVLIVLAGLMLISCKKEPETTPPIKADRTVLVYMAVSNMSIDIRGMRFCTV